MRFKLTPDKYLSRDMYNLASGANREYLEHVISHIKKMVDEKALEACIKTTEGDKSYELGFVKGVHECKELIVQAFLKGERLHYGTTDVDHGPKMF